LLSSKLFHCRFTSLIRRVEASERERDRERKTDRDRLVPNMLTSLFLSSLLGAGGRKWLQFN
jgi:hypothetical protein